MVEVMSLEIKMVEKIATAAEIVDGISFRLRTDQIIILNGMPPLQKGSEKDRKAAAKLAELILKKKVAYEATEIDTMGRSKANVKLDGLDVNKAMRDYIATL
jgi:hypothetical protein